MKHSMSKINAPLGQNPHDPLDEWDKYKGFRNKSDGLAKQYCYENVKSRLKLDKL